jgi:hypothetical protein
VLQWWIIETIHRTSYEFSGCLLFFGFGVMVEGKLSWSDHFVKELKWLIKKGRVWAMLIFLMKFFDIE